MGISVKINPILRKGSLDSSLSALVRFTSCAIAAGVQDRSGASAGWVWLNICIVFSSQLKAKQKGNKQSTELMGTNSSALNPEKDSRKSRPHYHLHIHPVVPTWCSWDHLRSEFYLLEIHGQDEDSLMKTILSDKMWNHRNIKRYFILRQCKQ